MAILEPQHIVHRKLEDVEMGKPIGKEDNFNVSDWSHLLKPDQVKQGYKLHLHESSDSSPLRSIHAILKGPHSDDMVGEVAGHIHSSTIHPTSRIVPNLRGQGFGKAMYTALLRHSINKGITHMGSFMRSKDAYHLHDSLAKEFGLKNPPHMPENELTSMDYGSYTMGLHRPDRVK